MVTPSRKWERMADNMERDEREIEKYARTMGEHNFSRTAGIMQNRFGRYPK